LVEHLKVPGAHRALKEFVFTFENFSSITDHAAGFEFQAVLEWKFFANQVNARERSAEGGGGFEVEFVAAAAFDFREYGISDA
jgi:hypothetical protein